MFVCFALSAAAVLTTTAAVLADESVDRPNILWLTCEDIGPHLGCYGDSFAVTPTLDALAKEGMKYRNAWSNAPVCAAARTTIIMGMYANSLGAHNMRSMVPKPSELKMFPELLREKGYYCTNNSKEDYNVQKSKNTWDDSSVKAHWRNRKPNQPFFSVFNFTDTHESQMRNRDTLIGDPSKVRVPAYHPDTPEVRHNWTLYYDRITEMDAKCRKILNELRKDGLYEDTIIIFFGDHGSGMPRNKRYLYNSGLQVPMIVRIPEKFKHLAPSEYSETETSERLVSFVDLAPTMLSLIGEKPKNYHEGTAFLGKYCEKPAQYIFGFRGRMDERDDLMHSVRNERYVYLRNYYPYKIYGQNVEYMFSTQTTKVWKKMFDEGKLNSAQSAFWMEKPTEELYDLTADPDEINNLANLPEYKTVLDEMRNALSDWEQKIIDPSFLPEGMLWDKSARKGISPYEMKHDTNIYPFQEIHKATLLATDRSVSDVKVIGDLLASDNSAVRYWGAVGLLQRAETNFDAVYPFLLKAIADDSPYVQIPAAEALASFGNDNDACNGLDILIDICMTKTEELLLIQQAHYSIYDIKRIDRLRGYKDQIEQFPIPSNLPHERYKEDIHKQLKSLKEKIAINNPE
ncbi:MAG: sulfatase-like hydrolase/transferase [Thermoguttaceae bacterium]